MTRRVLRLVPVLLAAVVGVTSVAMAWARGPAAGERRADERRFPHREHAKMFPTCETCHAGVMTGDSSARFPAVESCAECHDGDKEKRVSWDGPRVRPSNLNFSHPAHEREAKDEKPALVCQSCHALAGDTLYMGVERARLESCISCHAHRASAHLADDSKCTECHVPLTRAVRLSDSAVAALPIPESHRRPDFLADHAPTTARDPLQCATCHSRESCARCHPNANEAAGKEKLERDARVSRTVRGMAAEYFTPPSHRRPDWLAVHRDSATRQPLTCANCHAQASCRTCHIGRGASAQIAKLPRPDREAAPGVQLLVAPVELLQRAIAATNGDVTPRAAAAVAGPPLAIAPTRVETVNAAVQVTDTSVRVVRVHPPNFADRHGATASTGRMNCQGCHEERLCASCHDGAGRRRFHAFNFVSQHAASAAGRERDCTSCHNTETFCRACHRGEGLAARGTGEVAFHDRQPLWLLQHGQAARQDMQTCATCHQQRDCTRCHSDLGLRVNPHGPGFDAERMAKRNPQMCATCHIGDPLRPRP